jgi:hypothetical protein
MSEPAKRPGLFKHWTQAGLLVLVLLLGGCTALTGTNISDKCAISKNELYSRIDFRRIASLLAAELCDPSSPVAGSMRPEDAILVPDVLDVQTYKPEKVGIYLGDLLRASINARCKYPVRQLDLSDQFKLNDEGLVALTRDAAKAAQTSVSAHTAIVVTYSMQPSKMTLVGRTVHLSNSTIVSSSTKEVSWSCGKNLLGDVMFTSRVE